MYFNKAEHTCYRTNFLTPVLANIRGLILEFGLYFKLIKDCICCLFLGCESDVDSSLLAAIPLCVGVWGYGISPDLCDVLLCVLYLSIFMIGKRKLVVLFIIDERTKRKQ